MDTITHWHRFAYLYQTKELELAEITKLWIINSALGVCIEDDDSRRIGFNPFDNSELNDALVFGLIRHSPSNEPLPYSRLGKMLLYSESTIARSIKRLLQKGVISKARETGQGGAIFVIETELMSPKWIMLFTEAIAAIEYDEQLRMQVAENCRGISFLRNWKAMQSFLKDKYYRPRNKNQS